MRFIGFRSMGNTKSPAGCAASAPPGPIRFEAEPIRDLSIIALSLSFAGLLDLINSTGELHPQQIARDFDPDSLLFFDRIAVTQNLDSKWATYSNFGLAAAVVYAIADPIATGLREKNVQAGLVDLMIYAESMTVTYGITNLAKAAVKRPRPTAYKLAMMHMDDPNFVIADTDSSLSFFSGHASICASVTAVASYLAFARDPGGPRGWITLVTGAAVTTFVGVGRVRSGAHFPSDVMAGVLAGTGVGVLVTHYHRAETNKQRPMWIGFMREMDGTGGMFTLSGVF